jgi:hypothetical protein
MLRDSLVYMYSLYESGDFPVSQLSPKMAAWRGMANGRRGTVFAEEVAKAMRANGWYAEVEVKVTKLLGRGFDKDHGDVDVLAWRDDGRVQGRPVPQDARRDGGATRRLPRGDPPER